MKSLLDNKKKYIGSLLFLILLIGITFFIFLKDNDLKMLWQTIQQANPIYIALGILAMFGFIACEGLNLKVIFQSFGKQIPFLRCYKYAFISFYFSSITPGSSGGQPMQLYYMNKDNINLSLSSLTIFIIVFIWQIAELGFNFVMFVLNHTFVLKHAQGMGILIIYGIVFNLLLLTLILLAVFSKTILKRFLTWGIRILSKMKIIKYPEQVLQSINHQIAQYQSNAQHMKNNSTVLWKVLLITLLQLSCQYVVPFCVYKAFGFHQYNILEMMTIQALLSLAVGSLPLPGAVGVSEGGFMMLYRIFFTSSMLLPAMMLSRGISFYFMLLFSGAVVILVQLHTQKRQSQPTHTGLSGNPL